MAKVVTDDKHYKDIADTIRSRSADINGALDSVALRPEEMPGFVAQVCEESYSAGCAAGERAEQDRFWEIYQQKGKRENYGHAFAGYGWTTANFKPKYDLVPTSAQHMFGYGSMGGADLAAILDQCGVKLDTSKSKNFDCFTMYSSPKRFPVLDTTAADSLTNMFHNCMVENVEKLILRTDGSQTISNTFPYSSAFREIRFEGVIGKAGFNMQWALTLSHDSIVSIVAALSAATSGLTATLSLAAVNTAFETAQGAADGSTGAEWTALANTRSNWTINLV